MAEDTGMKKTFRAKPETLVYMEYINEVEGYDNDSDLIRDAIKSYYETIQAKKAEEQKEIEEKIEEKKISESATVSDLATSVLLLSKILVKKELPDEEIETKELTNDDLQM